MSVDNKDSVSAAMRYQTALKNVDQAANKLDQAANKLDQAAHKFQAVINLKNTTKPQYPSIATISRDNDANSSPAISSTDNLTPEEKDFAQMKLDVMKSTETSYPTLESLQEDAARTKQQAFAKEDNTVRKNPDKELDYSRSRLVGKKITNNTNKRAVRRKRTYNGKKSYKGKRSVRRNKSRISKN